MDRGVAVILTAVVGGMLAVQAPINSGLGKAVGTFQAAFISFLFGTIALAVIAGLSRRSPNVNGGWVGNGCPEAFGRTVLPCCLIGSPRQDAGRETRPAVLL